MIDQIYIYKKSGGFTLIELLVVIAVIGVLSSVVLASLNSARRKAQIAKARSEVRVLHEALLRYDIDNNAWPAICNNIDTVAKWNDTWKTGYLPEVGADPWGTPYFFDGCPNVECSAGNSAICSAGPNKAFGSWNRTDMTAVGDDICIYFEPQC